MASKITINGKTYIGNNVSILNNKVYVDGVLQGEEHGPTVRLIIVEGELNQLECDASVEAKNINGSVSAGGSISCGDIGGSVTAGGSVRAGKVGGAIMAGGSVRHG